MICAGYGLRDIEERIIPSPLSTYSNHSSLLGLLQLADSALPIGSTAHSFGLETLVAEGILTVDQLEQFLTDYMQEMGRLESAFCRQGYQLASVTDESEFVTGWLALHNRLGAFKIARESRTASATLGRRFLQLVCGLVANTGEISLRSAAGRPQGIAPTMVTNQPPKHNRTIVGAIPCGRPGEPEGAYLTRIVPCGRPGEPEGLIPPVCGLAASSRLSNALQVAKAQKTDVHYCIAFGLVSSILEIDETLAVLAYLQQALTGLISACQRLLPLGQTQASAILWRLKPVLIDVAEASATGLQLDEECAVFTPLPDIGSIRHPNLPTRLFIS